MLFKSDWWIITMFHCNTKVSLLSCVFTTHSVFFYTVSFFLRLTIGFYMLIFQPSVNFCSDKNIQTILGTKLEDFLNYRIDYNLISQTVEKVVKKLFLGRRNNSTSSGRQSSAIVGSTLSSTSTWRSPILDAFGALKIFFSQLFWQFGILNCNLSDNLKDLPTFFQKWFEYFHRNKS
jgi:hypothetical protein